jgi:hypothetical protein
MTRTISKVIPTVTDDGLPIAIPRSAWNEIQEIAEDEFSAELEVHLHDSPGAFHDNPFVPFAHYLIEATLDDDQIEAFTERVDPLIEDLIERFTRQTEVPAER